MAKNLQIRYTLQSGTLPNGLTLNPDSGLISGTVGFDSLGTGPTWSGPTSGSLGSFMEGDTFTKINFQSTTSKGPVIYSITSGYIPWGLTFTPATGALQGTIAPLKLRVAEQGSTSDGPVWSTAFGKLAQADESAVVSTSISATPIGSRTLKSYSVVSGFLPFGLRLNPLTGSISGTTSPLKNPGPFVDVPKLPVPVWSTSNTNTLATIDEGAATPTLTLAATPASGRSMNRYQIMSGGLPFGLKLNPLNGVITGTATEIKAPDPAFVDTANNPVFNTVIQYADVYGAVQRSVTVADGGSLGTYTKGSDVARIRIRAAVGSNTTGRSIRFYLKSGTLPWGLKMSLAGAATDINGVVFNNARTKTGTYTFTIAAFDVNDTLGRRNEATRTFTITIN